MLVSPGFCKLWEALTERRLLLESPAASVLRGELRAEPTDAQTPRPGSFQSPLLSRDGQMSPVCRSSPARHWPPHGAEALVDPPALPEPDHLLFRHQSQPVASLG